jgi:hypothetical protein
MVGRVLVFFAVAFVSLPLFGQTSDGIFVNRPGSELTGPQETVQETAIQETRIDVFRRIARQKIRAAVRSGKLTGRQARQARRVANRMGSVPAFAQLCERRAMQQLYYNALLTGDDSLLPMNDDGTINKAAIDWQGLGDFIERIIPILIMLLELFDKAAGFEVSFLFPIDSGQSVFVTILVA